MLFLFDTVFGVKPLFAGAVCCLLDWLFVVLMGGFLQFRLLFVYLVVLLLAGRIVVVCVSFCCLECLVGLVVCFWFVGLCF